MFRKSRLGVPVCPCSDQARRHSPVEAGPRAAQAIDEEYTKKIKRVYRSEPFFNSPLTECYLPASQKPSHADESRPRGATVPLQPPKILPDQRKSTNICAAGREKANARAFKVLLHRHSEEGREMIAVAVAQKN